jgi:hypothetical protein
MKLSECRCFLNLFLILCVFFRVVTSCNELEHFDFSGCDLVSYDTVKAALDSVKLRTSNTKLTLIVGGELNHSVTSVCSLFLSIEFTFLAPLVCGELQFII